MLNTLDYWVIAIYVLIVVAVCARVARRAPGADELFLAGRSLGPIAIGFSLFASNISSTTLIGLPGAAWLSGISVANYEWMAALVLVFSAVFVLPKLIAGRFTTLPEMLERRFDVRFRRYLSATSLFLSLALDTAGSLYAGALVLKLFIPGLSLGWTCAALALFAGLYTAAGGLRAVVYTDVLQAVVLLTGSVVLTVIVFGQFDYQWSQVVAAVPPEKLSLIRPLDDPALPWLGTLIGLPVLGFYYWTMNQYVSQRLLGARDLRAAGQGALLAAGLKLLPLFFMVLPGVMAVALFTDLEQPDTVFPQLIATYAPPGLAGLMLAGLLAAIMSSVDSALNSASTLVIADFVQPRRPALSQVQLARLGRYTTLIFMVLAALWAPQIQSFPGLFSYLQQTFAYVTPPLVAIFVLGLLWQKLGSAAAWRALIGGHFLSGAWFVATQAGWLNVHFTIVAGLLFFATALFAVFWQCLGSSASPAVTVDRHEKLSPGLLVGAGGLTGLTLLLVWIFR